MISYDRTSFVFIYFFDPQGFYEFNDVKYNKYHINLWCYKTTLCHNNCIRILCLIEISMYTVHEFRRDWWSNRRL